MYCVCVCVFYLQICMKLLSFYEKLSEIWLKMYVGLHAERCYFYEIVMKLEFSVQIFEKYKNIKFYENLSSGSRVVSRGWRDRETDRQT